MEAPDECLGAHNTYWRNLRLLNETGAPRVGVPVVSKGRGGGFDGIGLAFTDDLDQVRKEVETRLCLERINGDPVVFEELTLRSEMLVDVRTSRLRGAILAQERLVVMCRHGHSKTIRVRCTRASLHEAARYDVELVRGLCPLVHLLL